MSSWKTKPSQIFWKGLWKCTQYMCTRKRLLTLSFAEFLKMEVIMNNGRPNFNQVDILLILVYYTHTYANYGNLLKTWYVVGFCHWLIWHVHSVLCIFLSVIAFVNKNYVGVTFYNFTKCCTVMQCMHLIREAGGAFGKRQATKEDEYFRKLVI